MSDHAAPGRFVLLDEMLPRLLARELQDPSSYHRCRAGLDGDPERRTKLEDLRSISNALREAVATVAAGEVVHVSR